MNSTTRSIAIIAGNELADSARSRRAIVMMLLYMIGAMAGTALFIGILNGIEREMTRSLGITASDNSGGVTATLWKSEAFRKTVTHLVGNTALAESLLAVPPLALFYGWLTFAFGPVLVMLTSSTRIAEEIASGSVRFVMFRVGRWQWCVGKFIGQALQVLLAFLLSAVAAWVVGMFRMHSFEPWSTAAYMLVFAVKAWVYAMPFLGLALAISQFCAIPNLALAFGVISLVGVSITSRLCSWLDGDGWRHIWGVVNLFMPGSHRENLWWNDVSHLVPGVAFLLGLAALYMMIGYARFARRDL